MIIEQHQDLLLIWQGRESIPDAEWKAMVRSMHQHPSRELKVLVVTLGGAPSPSQQLELATLRGRKALTVAAVSDSTGVRFVASSVALFTKNVRTFSPKDVAKAYVYLELSGGQLEAARRFCGEQLGRQSPGP